MREGGQGRKEVVKELIQKVRGEIITVNESLPPTHTKQLKVLDLKRSCFKVKLKTAILHSIARVYKLGYRLAPPTFSIYG